MTDNISTGIIDEPIRRGGVDGLDIQRHANALAEFIKKAPTPITIGIQGEWGSGKTSILNSIYFDIEKQGNYKQIWINSWENSLLSSPEEALLKIINEIICELLDADISKANKEKVKTVIASLGKSALRISASLALGSGAQAVAEELLSSGGNSIRKLREQLEDLSKEIRDRDTNPYDKIVIYVDDLDRIEPKDAVRVLELLKNIFSVEGCVFVLAIDYQVVVKGLEHKFGKRSSENEWEFRAFFDKIIQLPFMMPMGQYNIGKYVQTLLRKIGFITNDEINTETIGRIITYSIGGNPRALKRLVNSLSLITIFLYFDKENQGTTILDFKDKKILLFALICIQIAYPNIYDVLGSYPDFGSWNESVSYEITRLKEEENKEKFEKDLSNFKKTDDFDEEWEECLLRLCYTNPRYYKRVIDISKLFNYIKNDILGKTEDSLEDIISEVMSETSVTSINVTNDSQAISQISSRKSGIFGVVINGAVFKDKSLFLLSKNILEYLVDNNLIDKIECPWGVTKSRCILSNEPNPIHPSGRSFFKPVEYKGYTLETHYDRDRGIQNIKRLCTDLDIEFSTN